MEATYLFQHAVIDVTPRPLVSCYNEWDPLEEVIVGRVDNAQIADKDHGLYAIEYRDYGSVDNIPSGRYPQHILDKTAEELEELVAEFEKAGVTVRRPDPFDHSAKHSTPHWQTSGQYNYCPRDLFFVMGDLIVESPMTLRARQCETLSYRKIMRDYLASGARWISPPKPLLLDEDYLLNSETGISIAENDPIFDAANVLRIGTDVLYLVSDSGNRLGAKWLQTILGPEYTVHLLEGAYSGSHIDTTITLVKPGLVVASRERISDATLPAIFKNWDVIYMEDVVDIGYTNTSYASKWIGLNFMMLNPTTAVLDKRQTGLIKELERRRVDIMPLQLTHARTLGGGFHCVTMDVRRKGRLESYCN